MVAMCSLLRYPAEVHSPAVMRPFAAAVRPWHPSELARLGRNAVEDPASAGLPRADGCRTLGASIGGKCASACAGREDMAIAAVGPSRQAEAAGLAQGSTGALAARSIAGHEMTPSPLAPRERPSPEWAETPQAARSRGAFAAR